MHPVITDTESLAVLCARLAGETFVTIDTEFIRERTYYPQLCLIQIAGEKEAAAIDPLSSGLDLVPLWQLLANQNVLKVFHACRQDMEIFYQLMGALPAPIFDTQVAAMVGGLGESVSYENLIAKVLGKRVDKSSRFSDWAYRPLTEKQLEYAMGDVTYLRDAYSALAKQLAEQHRASWIDGEMQILMQPETYEVNPDDVWRKLRLRTTSPRYLAQVQAAAKWRELTARARNVPRGRVMKDEILVEVASACPKDVEALRKIRGFTPSLQTHYYDELIAALQHAATLPIKECPELPPRPIVSDATEAVVDLLRLLLKACAATHHVVPRIIADRDELEALASGAREGIAILSGWRYEMFGKEALKLLEGKIALSADGEKGIIFIDLDL